MSKKITRIYLSILIFILAFFGIYSIRFHVYDFLNENHIYSETLSSKQISSAKHYLEDTKSFTNINKLKKDLNKIFKEGSYSVSLLEREDGEIVFSNNVLFNGKAPYEKTFKYIVRIETNDSLIEWFPSFSNYYLMYQIVDVLISLIIAVLFYCLLKKELIHLPKKNLFHTLSTKMLFTLGMSTVLVFSLFVFMYFNQDTVLEFIMDTWYESENYDGVAQSIQKEVKSLKLSKKNKKNINEILKKYQNKHSLYYIYDEEGNYFAGKNNANSVLYETDSETVSIPLFYEYSIQFKNETATLEVTSYPLVIYQIPYVTVSLMISFSFYIIILQSFIKKRVESIQALQEDVNNLAQGDWNHEIQVNDNDEIGLLANDLNQMRLAFLNSMENEQQARKANHDLISSLSHDLRTPLTTLKGYLEIVSMQDTDKRDIYLKKCLNKVEEITYLSNKMFEYSLVYSTEYNADLKSVQTQEIQTLIQDHIQFLEEMDLRVNSTMCNENMSLQANIAMLQRILNNVFSNIQKYCDPWKEIEINTKIENKKYILSFTNSINHNLSKVESNGIGLKSVQKMMELHHGTLSKEQSDDVFTITLFFPIQK